MYLDPSFLADSNSEEAVENCRCLICSGVLLNPVQCSKCNNSFCKLCIEKWSEESSLCPLRCKDPQYHPSIKAINILNQLTFYCPNGCNEIIPYKDLIDHTEAKCPLLNYKKKIEEYSALIGDKIEEFNGIKEYIDVYKQSIDDLKVGKIPPRTIFVTQHKHPLIFGKRNNPWLCDKCNAHFYYGDKSFYCKECDFDFCCGCYLKEVYGFQ